LRKFDFETAPVVLGVVLAPIIEVSFQAISCHVGWQYAIFVQRPVSVIFLASAVVMILLAVKPLIRKKSASGKSDGGAEGQMSIGGEVTIKRKKRIFLKEL